MERELREILERGVKAIEALAEDPVIQVETMPPVCPHCEQMNPNVSVSESEGQGPLAEIVIKATCLNCDKGFIVIPVQYQCAVTVEEAVELLKERMKASGFNGGENQGT